MRLTFDLGDFWQDTKGQVQEAYMLWTDPKEAPPSVRRIPVAHYPLKDNNNNPVGTFAPEIYELACVRGLKAQQAEDAWNVLNPGAPIALKQTQAFYNELYKANGTAKTAFELAVLPVIFDDNNQESTNKVREIIAAEFLNRIQKDQPLPPTVYKYLTKSDYLKNLHLINLQTMGPRDVTVEVQNPANQTRFRDRAVHYFAQRTSLILTLVAALSVTASSPAWFVAAAMGALLAEWCGKEFGTYGIGETVLRDVKSIFSEDFRWGSAISLKKTIKTAALLTAVGVLALGAITAGWAAVMALPVWSMAQAPWAITALTGLQFATAGFVSSAGGLMTFVGAKDAMHFFWGLGIWDKQIDFGHEAQLPPLTNEIERAHDLNREKRKLSAGVTDEHKLAKINKYFAKLEKVLNKEDKVVTSPVEVASTELVNSASNVLAFSAKPQAKQDEKQAAVVEKRRSSRLQAK